MFSQCSINAQVYILSVLSVLRLVVIVRERAFMTHNTRFQMTRLDSIKRYCLQNPRLKGSKQVRIDAIDVIDNTLL